MSVNDTFYTGWKKWTPTLDEWAEFSVTQQPPFELKENEYLLVYVEEEGKTKLVSQYYQEGGKLRKFGRGTINFRSKKSADKNISIKPRNDEQVCAMELMHNSKKTVKLLTGTWGTGKTMLLVTAALEALEHNVFERIVWIRNNVDVKDTKDLGALPGEVNEKLLPFLGPFIDHCGEAGVECMLSNGKLVIEPLQSLRGRNLENTLIMCSEAENLTKEHIQLIIARAAEGSQVWFDADVRQRDKAIFEKSKGIETMIERFAGHKRFGYVHLIVTERSETAAMADLLND